MYINKKYLLIFSSDSKYANAAERLRNQAINLGWFDKIIVYGSSDDLIGYRPECFENGFSAKYPKGAGLWAWKPEFISYCLDHLIDANSIICYLDAGVELNKYGKDKLFQYFKIAELGKFIATRTHKIEYLYSNLLLIKYLNPSILNLVSYQYQAGLLIFKNTKENINFIKQWESLCKLNNYRLLTAYSPLYPYIGENRHDQAIFSLLFKRLNYRFSIGLPLSGNREAIIRSRYMKSFPFFSMRNYTNNLIINYFQCGESTSAYRHRVVYLILRIYYKLFIGKNE